MSSLLKASLMVMGAACVLLAAGGFPQMGAPEVYQGGMMLTLGALAALLSLWAGWRLAKGDRTRFITGLFCTFFTVTGLVAAWEFGTQALRYAQIGGAMWFGALGMGSLAFVGLLFTSIFGYFMLRLMNRRLWLAGVHWCLFMIALGAYIDYVYEIRCKLYLPADGKSILSEATSEDGVRHPLGFTLRADKFNIESYEAAPSYTLLQWQGDRWEPVGQPERKDGTIILGEESWPADSLKTMPTLQRPCFLLPGSPARLLIENAPAIRSYSVDCLTSCDYRGKKEERPATLRVNEPISCNGWNIYLMSYHPMGNAALLQLEARRAPGRFAALAGMAGLMICASFWCWWKKEESGSPAPLKA